MSGKIYSGADFTDILHFPARVVITTADPLMSARTARSVLEELSGVSERPMIIPMTTTGRVQQRYDHRLRNLVQRTRDVTIATERGNALGIDGQKDERPLRGRKSKYESRATELRQKLGVWKETPESERQSLRALARENNTSHQLLSFYLKRLEKEKDIEPRHKVEETRLGCDNERAESESRAAATPVRIIVATEEAKQRFLRLLRRNNLPLT